MKTHAENSSPYIQRIWTEVAIPGALAMIAHAQGDWNQAIAIFETIRENLCIIGGTNTQLDLFEQVYIDAVSKSGEKDLALELLSKRAALRRNVSVGSCMEVTAN